MCARAGSDLCSVADFDPLPQDSPENQGNRMNRVPLIDRSEARAESKTLLDAIHGAFGLPNEDVDLSPTPRPRSSPCGARSAPLVPA